MTGGGSPELRVLIVGADPDVQAALHLYLDRVGARLWCLPLPDELDAVASVRAPQAIVLLVPPVLDAPWTRALAGTSAGAQVTVVASSAESRLLLSQRAPAARVLLRSEVLANPLGVLERAVTPGPSRAATPPGPPVTEANILELIEDELEEVLVGEEVRPALLDVVVSLVSESNFFVGSTGRIDSGGVFVASYVMPDMGSVVELSLGLPDGRKVMVQGEVAFVRRKATVGRSHGAGFGVRLKNLPTWVVQSIEGFMKARPPNRYLPPGA